MRKEVITHSVVSAIHRGRHWWCGSTEKRNFFLLRREEIARKEELCINSDYSLWQGGPGGRWHLLSQNQGRWHVAHGIDSDRVIQTLTELALGHQRSPHRQGTEVQRGQYNVQINVIYKEMNGLVSALSFNPVKRNLLLLNYSSLESTGLSGIIASHVGPRGPSLG